MLFDLKVFFNSRQSGLFGGPGHSSGPRPHGGRPRPHGGRCCGRGPELPPRLVTMGSKMAAATRAVQVRAAPARRCLTQPEPWLLGTGARFSCCHRRAAGLRWPRLEDTPLGRPVSLGGAVQGRARGVAGARCCDSSGCGAGCHLLPKMGLSKVKVLRAGRAQVAIPCAEAL